MFLIQLNTSCLTVIITPIIPRPIPLDHYPLSHTNYLDYLFNFSLFPGYLSHLLTPFLPITTPAPSRGRVPVTRRYLPPGDPPITCGSPVRAASLVLSSLPPTHRPTVLSTPLADVTSRPLPTAGPVNSATLPVPPATVGSVKPSCGAVWENQHRELMSRGRRPQQDQKTVNINTGCCLIPNVSF